MRAPEPPPLAVAPQPLIGWGEVRHTRLRPVHHAFAYPTFFLLLPMRTLAAAPSTALPRNRRAPIAFHDADHGDGGGDSLAWLLALLAAEGVDDADGEIWLHCLPRVLGYAFKPVSFWYCHRADLSLAAIVVEVNNTFGERHCYLLRGPDLAWGRDLQSSKVFHVSPFCRVAGDYRFRFFRNDQVLAAGQPRTLARIDHHDEQGPLLLTSVSGDLSPLTRGSLRRAFWRMPLLTLGVMARIHWQAGKLWLAHVPLVRKPDPPASFVSHGSSSAAP